MDKLLHLARKTIRETILAEKEIDFSGQKEGHHNFTLDVIQKALLLELEDEQEPFHAAYMKNILAETYLFQGKIEEAWRLAGSIAGNEEISNEIRAYSYAILAQVDFFKKDYSAAEENCKKALAFGSGANKKYRGKILNTIASAHFYNKRYELSLQYLYLYVKLSEDSGGHSLQTTSKANMALTLLAMDRVDEADKEITKALEIAKKNNMKVAKGNCLTIKAKIECERGNFKLSIKYAKEAIELLIEMEHHRLLPSCYNTIALCYFSMEKSENGLEYAYKALEYAKNFGFADYIIMAHTTLGQLYEIIDGSKAEQNYKSAMDMFERIEDKESKQGYFELLHKYGKFISGQGRKEGFDMLRKVKQNLLSMPRTQKVEKLLASLSVIDGMHTRQLIEHAEERIYELERKNRYLERLQAISEAINSEEKLESILRLIVKTSLDISGAERGFIAIVEPRHMKFTAITNMLAGVEDENEFAKIDYALSQTVKSGDLFSHSEEGEDLKSRVTIWELAPNIKSIYAFPMKDKNSVIAVLYIDSRYAAIRLNEDEEMLIRNMLEQATLVVNKMQRYENLGREYDLKNEELRKTKSNLENIQKELEEKYSYKSIVGNSRPIREMFSLLDKIRNSDLPVYIFGESGSGKELVARAIHYQGSRKSRQFITINCAAIPESLLESELFGFEKGAFTGANKSTPGLFEKASGGTLFLDEIGNMSDSMQKKILRTLQENEIRRIGADHSHKIDVRIITASNQRLENLIEENRFRLDLYYRLNVLRLDIPPLRERKEDIPILADYFWEKYSGKKIDASPEIKLEYYNLLAAYDWPGNVRELENDIQRMISLGQGSFDLKYFEKYHSEEKSMTNHADSSIVPGKDESLDSILDNIERNSIINALRHSNGRKAKAAAFLNIPRTSLYRKIKKYNIIFEVLPKTKE